MEYHEFKAVVQKRYLEMTKNDEDAQKYFISNEAQDVIKRNYEAYKKPQHFAGVEPEATAYCLYMMQD